MNADFIDINLLPRPVRPALGGAAWQRLMVPGLALMAVATLFVLGSTFLKIRNDRMLSQQRIEMQQVREGVKDFSSIMAQVEILQQQVTTLATQAEQLEEDAERVNQANPALAPFLDAITQSLLPRMKVTGVVAQGANRFLVQGEAGTDSLVVAYVQALQRRPEIRSVTPRTIEQLGGDAPPSAVRWILEVQR